MFSNTNQLDQQDAALDSIFKRLIRWRHLPSYQLERRVDVFFSCVLPEILEKVFSKARSDFLGVIPEFPLHKGLILNENNRSDNSSVKVDFAVFYKDPNRIFLIELKTDNHSIDRAQLTNLKKAEKVNAHTLFKGVMKCAKHSDSPRKYVHLIYNLNEMGCLKNTHTLFNIDLDEKRCRLKDKFRDICESQDWTNAEISFKIIYPGGDDPKTRSVESKIAIVEALPKEKRASFSSVMSGLGEHPLTNFLQELSKYESGRATPPWRTEATG